MAHKVYEHDPEVTVKSVIDWIAPKHWSDDVVLRELADTVADLITVYYSIEQLRMDYGYYMNLKERTVKDGS